MTWCRQRYTDNSILPPLRYRVGVLCFALLQNSLVGGLTFGWASIDQSMLHASEEDGGAALALHDTIILFTLASSISMVSSLVLGIVLDTYGPRICAVVGTCIVGLGCQIFASAHEFAGFALGTCLIAFGGPGVSFSILHISNLFPGNEYMCMSVLSGSVAFSFSVYALFDIMWESSEDTTFRTLFSSYVLVCATLAIVSFWLYPDESFEKLEEDFFVELAEGVDGDLLLDVAEESNPNPTSTLSSNTFLESNEVKHRPSRVEQATIWHEQEFLHGPSRLQRPSLTIEQPLSSFLRDDHKMLHKSESYLQSECALKSGDAKAVQFMSLKDQPFYEQLFSAVYFRSLIIFLVTSFFVNFYVASISTEVRFSRELRVFSLIRVYWRIFWPYPSLLLRCTACGYARFPGQRTA
jgi:MFS family permease